ncbi:MAG: phosphatidylcholine synthase [Ilumatobacteraceae bacterium]
MIHHLFVYGTLAPGQQRWPHLAPFVVDEGHDAAVVGALYDTGNGYPAARFDRPGVITGRIYELRVEHLDEALRQLDEVEGAVLDLFGRVAVTTVAGVEAWAYEYHGDADLREIAGGRWVASPFEGATGEGIANLVTNETSTANVVDNNYSRRKIRNAWAVHALTASGVIVGYIGLNSVIGGHARAAILWLIAALILDGVDGPIARKLDVRSRIPTLNGNSLDLIIDYFTCTIVPVAFLYRFDILPDDTVVPVGFAILFVSALWMARTDQETEDGWFNGFPAEWNMIIPSLFLIRADPWVNFVICAIFIALTLSRVQFAHPVSVRERRAVSLTFMIAWLASMTWLAIVERDIPAVRYVLIAAPLWTVAQVLMRLNHTDEALT